MEYNNGIPALARVSSKLPNLFGIFQNPEISQYF